MWFPGSQKWDLENPAKAVNGSRIGIEFSHPSIRLRKDGALGLERRVPEWDISLLRKSAILLSIMSVSDLTFGYPEEWKAFQNRNQLFIDLFPTLHAAVEMAFTRDFTAPEIIDLFVVMYGRLCFEDFTEIIVCCGNGSGIAASKLLRTFYERAVTIAYLNDHPDEIQNFIDYHAVAQRKLFYSLQEIFGKDHMLPGTEDKMIADFEEVKEKFMIPLCKKCGTRRLNHTWSKLDFVAMAKATGALGKMINQAYYLPMRRTHSTVAALLERIEQGSNGAMSFNPDAQRRSADMTLMTAHHVMLEVLKIQDKRFALPGLAEKVEECYGDWVKIWKGKTFGEDPSEPI